MIDPKKFSKMKTIDSFGKSTTGTKAEIKSNESTTQQPQQPQQEQHRRSNRKQMNNYQDIKNRCDSIDKRAVFGASALGFPDKISPVRAEMATKHGATQRVVLTNPEFPRLYTGAENEFGALSSWNVVAKSDLEIKRIFMKFKDYPDYSPIAYIYLNKSNGKYGCKIVTPVVRVTEKYGFRMKNLIANKREGDIIPEGMPITQSSSYVDNLYCGGRNIRMMYANHPDLTEDALVISDYAAEVLSFDMVDEVTVDIGKNAYLRNRYGKDGAYKPFPNIGEWIENDVICSIRENSFVSSVAEASIPHINDKNLYSHGIIVDIDILTNVEVENEQFNYYLRQITDWYNDIYSYISKIITDPYQDDTTLLDIYNKAEKFLFSKAMWADKEYIADTIMKFKVLQPTPIRVGQKVTGRYGNKSVVAKIIPRHLMPRTVEFDENGNPIPGTERPVDMLANGLAIGNRIIGFASYEGKITYQSERIWEHIVKLKENGVSRDEIMGIVLDFINNFNPGQHNELARVYNQYPEEVFNDIIDNGICINIEPLNEVCVRDALIANDKQFKDILKPYKVQTKLRHRWITHDDTHNVGYQYTWVLKQEPSKYLTAVSTGRTTLYDLAVKTKQYKEHLKHYSDNAIKFGEYDTYNFLAAVDVKTFAKIATYFRGSQYEENSVLMGQLNGKELDLTKYNKFPQLDNLHNCFKFIGIGMKSTGGFATIGPIDDIQEIYIGNIPVKISLPNLSYVLMIYSYYTQYEQYLNGAVDIVEFLTKVKATNVFDRKPDWYIDWVCEEFVNLLPVLQQLKQYR